MAIEFPAIVVAAFTVLAGIVPTAPAPGPEPVCTEVSDPAPAARAPQDPVVLVFRCDAPGTRTSPAPSATTGTEGQASVRPPSAPSPQGAARPAAPAPPPGSGPSAPVRATRPFYVDTTTPAAQQVRDWEEEGRTADAAQLRKLADQPQPLWVSADAGAVEAEVAEYVGRAKAAGARPLLVGYNIPDRDCGSFSGGGAGDAEGYQAWAEAFAAGLNGGDAPDGNDALVVLEPDAIPHQLSGCAGGGEERYAMISRATDTLTAAGAAVYIDAGHPGFTGDVEATAGALERAGVRRAAGFSLNVSNFLSTQENITYGSAISKRLGGTHFVIDTSRNGATTPTESTDDAPEWCNPPGRKLGAPPTTETGNPLVDALLWIKRPGESDGNCRSGDPTAGGWFPEYALQLTST